MLFIPLAKPCETGSLVIIFNFFPNWNVCKSVRIFATCVVIYRTFPHLSIDRRFLGIFGIGESLQRAPVSTGEAWIQIATATRTSLGVQSWQYFAVIFPVITIMKFMCCGGRNTPWSKVTVICLRIIPLLLHFTTGGSSVPDVLKIGKFKN